MEFGKVRIPWKDWKVVSQIGEGGYGKVYQIERTQSDITDCEALKVIRIPKDENEYKEIVKDKGSAEKAKAYILKQKENVLNEVKKLKEIQGSENIVIIKEWAIEELEDGYSWEVLIRMELLTPLDKKIEEEGLPDEAEVIRIGSDICSALSRCEKKKIIHRDIKQGNILVSDDGVYKLSDFGISRNLESVTTVTGVGAKPYMAPEVAKYLKTGKTIDTYSLGIVLYELLNNNRIPFLEAEGDFTTLDKGRAIQRRIDGEKLPEPANGSEELKRVILKACEYNPKDRYKNAEEMKEALLKIVRGEEETVNEKEINSEEGEAHTKEEEMTIAAPANQEAEIEALKSRLTSLVEANEHSDFALTPFPERTLELDNEKGKQTDAQSLEELEKELFGTTAGEDDEYETNKKIDKFYTLYKKNEEFQRLLDEEYSRLKGEHIDLPDEDFKNEPEVIAEDNFIFKPEVTAEDDVIFAGLSSAHEKAVREELASEETPTAEPTVADLLEKHVPQYYGYEINDDKEDVDADPIPTTSEETEINDALSLEDLEKGRFDTVITEDDEFETNKKIDKFYALYEKNEEYQRLLDEEYRKLKSDNLSNPDNAYSSSDIDIDYPGTRVDDISQNELRHDSSSIEEPIENNESVQRKPQNKDGNMGCIVLLLIIIGIALFIFRDRWISLLPLTHDEDEMFKEYVQALYDNADTYRQGFPVYYSNNDNNAGNDNNSGIVYLKFAISDFDRDRKNELLIYSADEIDIDYFYGVNLPNDSDLQGYLFYYELKDNEVIEIHHTDYSLGGSLLDDMAFYDNGIAMFDGENPNYNEHTWNVYDINGKNLNHEFYEGEYIRFTEEDNNIIGRDIASLQSQFEHKEITQEKFEEEWENYKNEAELISVDFASFSWLDESEENEEIIKRKKTGIDEITGREWSHVDSNNNEYLIYLEPSSQDYKGKGCLHCFTPTDDVDGMIVRELDRKEKGNWFITDGGINLVVSLSGDGKSLYTYQISYNSDNDELLLTNNDETLNFKSSTRDEMIPVDDYEMAVDYAKQFAQNCGYDLEKEVPGIVCRFSGNDWNIIEAYSIEKVGAGMGSAYDQYLVFSWKIDRNGEITSLEDAHTIRMTDILGNVTTIRKPLHGAITSEIDAVNYAKKIAEIANIDISYSENIKVRCEKKEADGYYIRAYEDHPDHVVTIFTCRILPTGTVKDFISH